MCARNLCDLCEKVKIVKVYIISTNDKGCSRIKCVGGSGGSLIFLTWVVGILIDKILWVVGDKQIRNACLVGKLKPAELIFVVLM